MNFLQLAGLDVHRDVPLEEISARKAELVEAYSTAKIESDKSGKKLPKRFLDYGENLTNTENIRNLMAFLRQAAHQANAAILCDYVQRTAPGFELWIGNLLDEGVRQQQLHFVLF